MKLSKIIKEIKRPFYKKLIEYFFTLWNNRFFRGLCIRNLRKNGHTYYEFQYSTTIERKVPYFLECFDTNRDSIDQKIELLKQDMDELSRLIIDRILLMYRMFMPLYQNAMTFDPAGDPQANFFILSRSFLVSPQEQREIKQLKQDMASTNCSHFVFPRKLPSEPEIVASKRSLIYVDRPAEKLKGKDILDCGANIGDSALIYSEYSPRSVHAFEPEKKTFQTLQQVIQMNAKEKTIVPVMLATGDRSQTLQFYTDGENDAGASLIPKNSSESYDVECVTIDEYVKEHNLNVGLIKMDIEGAEYASILGATETIKTFKPVLIISIYHTPKDFFEIKPYLEGLNLGYKFSVRQLPCYVGTLGEVELIGYV